MIFIAGVDSFMNVPMETTTFLAAALGFMALVLVFFLYINRKWCFNTTNGFACCDENIIATKNVIRRKYPYNGNSSSDSEEDILRRLKLQQSNSFQSTRYSHYGAGEEHLINKSSTNTALHSPQPPINGSNHNRINNSNTNHSLSNQIKSTNFSSIQHIKRLSSASLTNKYAGDYSDPLAMAERGKIGVPCGTSSECSSNSSVDASVESNTGLMSGEKKDRRSIMMHNVKVQQTSPIKETRIEKVGDSKQSSVQSLSSNKYSKLSLQQQNSLEEIPDINANSSQDCIVVMQEQEPLFDTSDIKSLQSEIDQPLRPGSPNSTVGRNGSLEVSLLYDAPMRKMTVHVLQARFIPLGLKNQPTHTQVRLLMLPSKKQKHKTKIRSGENPQFMESFLLHRVNPEEVNSMGIRIRVYGCERMRRERLIGEAVVSFATIDLELETNLWLPLEPRSSANLSGSTSDLLSLARSDSTGSTTSMQHGGVPELLIALGYNGITGRLTVEVVKGSHFRNLQLTKAPDTYVKLCLVSSMGQEMARAKTSTRRGQPNPLFKETFIFQVALFQLNDVTLMVSVYAKRNMKRNEMVGWFSLGLNSSGPEEMGHWADMRDSSNGKCDLLARWHVLVDS